MNCGVKGERRGVRGGRKGGRTRRALSHLPKPRKLVLPLLLIHRVVPPPDQLDREIPPRIEDLAGDLIASRDTAPGGAFDERDGRLS